MLRSVWPSYFYSVATLSLLDLLTFLVPHVVHYLKLGRLVPSTNPCHPKADKFHKIQTISLKLAPVRANCKYLPKKVSKFCCIGLRDSVFRIIMRKYIWTNTWLSRGSIWTVVAFALLQNNTIWEVSACNSMAYDFSLFLGHLWELRVKALTFTLLLITVLVLASPWISEPVYGQSKLAIFFCYNCITINLQ